MQISIMTITIITLSRVKINIMTISIRKLSLMKISIMTLSLYNDIQPNANQHNNTLLITEKIMAICIKIVSMTTLSIRTLCIMD